MNTAFPRWSASVDLASLLSLLGLGFCLLVLPARAQWITQTNLLKPGWNAVYLHVDPDHDTINNLVGVTVPIEEIWHWDTSQQTVERLVDSPQTGQQPSRWNTWHRTNAPSDMKLMGNGAYLVRVNYSVTSYTWRVKGKPVMPKYEWSLTGLNFLGFPTLPNAPTNFASFFQAAPELLTADSSLFRYQGGEFGPTNPVAITPFLAPITRVMRDQAYWARAGETYLQYFGPFQIQASDSSGIRFGTQGGQARFRIRNMVTNNITVTLTMVPSETNPTNGSNPALPPLLLRGPINPTNLTYSHTPLAGQTVWNLAGKGLLGSEVEVTLGLNRSAMAGVPGTFFGGVLRLTDSLKYLQVDMGVSAVKESTQGLWVGGVEVTNVHHTLIRYAQATSPTAFTNLLIAKQLAQTNNGVLQALNNYRYGWDSASGRVQVYNGPDTNDPARGHYLLDGPVDVRPGSVPNSFPLRLILHDSGSSQRLLQQVFFGPHRTTTNMVLATAENVLNLGLLEHARRISAVHLPLAGSWPLTNSASGMVPNATLTTRVDLGKNTTKSNPFLHTYHPDHDGLGVGSDQEVYDVTRWIAVTLAAPANDFNSLTQGAQALTGFYRELLEVSAGTVPNVTPNLKLSKQFTVEGVVSLQRISEDPNLLNN